jgi:alpha/beta superfamily hydrolase
MEKKISFSSDSLQIEGLISEVGQDKGVVITHPHPHYGGDMNNIVVYTIKEAYHSCGYTTLRFNFRGTGGSDGSFEDGKGEREDVKSAISYLKKMGIKTIHLAGYSFGTWVNSMADTKVDELLMVAPPVDFITFQKELKLPLLKLIISGSDDEFASKVTLERAAKEWNENVKLIFINSCDHFFSSSLDILKDLIVKNLK